MTSLLVGADGSWSRVRPQLSDATPEYTGTSFVETYLFDADTRHAGASRVVGDGSMLAPSPGKEISAHRENGATLHAYVALSRPEDWFATVDFSAPSAATARIARELDGWAPELTATVSARGATTTTAFAGPGACRRAGTAAETTPVAAAEPPGRARTSLTGR